MIVESATSELLQVMIAMGKQGSFSFRFKFSNKLHFLSRDTLLIDTGRNKGHNWRTRVFDFLHTKDQE